jgi:hypothetical protein
MIENREVGTAQVAPDSLVKASENRFPPSGFGFTVGLS